MAPNRNYIFFKKKRIRAEPVERALHVKSLNNTIGIVWKGQTCKGDQGLEIPGALPPQAAAAAAAKSLLSCPTLRPHRRQPTRLPHPWNSPGKNTGVGCHFLLQCMKVKSESKVTQSCPTLRDPMDCSLPGSSIHGVFHLVFSNNFLASSLPLYNQFSLYIS